MYISLVMILHGTTSALDFAVKTMWVPGLKVHTGVMLPDLTSVQLGQDTIRIYYVYNDVHTVTYLHCFISVFGLSWAYPVLSSGKAPSHDLMEHFL